MIRGKTILIDDLIQLADLGAAPITPGTVTMLQVVPNLEILHLLSSQNVFQFEKMQFQRFVLQDRGFMFSRFKFR